MGEELSKTSGLLGEKEDSTVEKISAHVNPQLSEGGVEPSLHKAKLALDRVLI